MKSKFNKILLVKKTTRYERMKDSDQAINPYVENVLKKNWYSLVNNVDITLKVRSCKCPHINCRVVLSNSIKKRQRSHNEKRLGCIT